MTIIKPLPLITVVAITPTFCIAAPVDDFFAISAYLGGRFSGDFEDKDTGKKANISNDFAQALALTWHYGHNTKGEIFYSHSKPKITMPEKSVSTDVTISYLHFGGRINFMNENSFSTSLGLGVGATFFVVDEKQYDNDTALSASITGGMRYELNNSWALRADLRVYGTVMQNNSSLFCNNNECLIQFSGDVYLQTELMAGIEYKF